MLINDLVTENALLWKYVNDTKASIISETVAKGELSNAQRITDRVIKRSPQNRVLAPVVQTSDSAIHRINHYPADSVIDFPNTNPLNSDLSGPGCSNVG